MLLKTITVFLLASSGLWAQMILPYAQSFSEPCTAGVGGVTQYQSVRTVNDGTTPASGALPGCIVVPTLSTNTVGAGHGIAQTAATVGQLVMVVQLGQTQAWSDTNVTINDVMIPSSATNGLVSDSGASANGSLTNSVGSRGRAMTAATGCSGGSPCVFTLELYPNQTKGGLFGSAAYVDSSAFDASGAAAVVQGLALLKANNLSDLASAATSRSNLGISTVGNTGSYSDLTGKPTIPSGQVSSDWNSVVSPTLILNKPTLATVATSGAYADLTGKPTIPAAQVNSDWNAVSGLPQILNRPLLTQASATRTLNTCFQVSTTHAAEVHYSVELGTSVSLTGGATGTVFLETFTDSACTLGVQELGRITNGNTGTLVVGLTLNQIVAGQVSGWVTPAAWVKLVTSNVTGTPTFTYRSGQEVLF